MQILTFDEYRATVCSRWAGDCFGALVLTLMLLLIEVLNQINEIKICSVQDLILIEYLPDCFIFIKSNIKMSILF